MKASELAFHPGFADDLAEAAEYFEVEAGLGHALVGDYEASLARIAANPELYQLQHHGHRRANLSRFPYSIRYVWERGTVHVVAFVHHRHDTAHWLRRLAERAG